ncbi:lysozyme C-like [Discoglossus pictus]
MKTFVVLLIMAILAGDIWAIDRCTLVKELRKTCTKSIKGATIEDLVCVAYYASRYNTSMHVRDTEVGIFQMSTFWWCDDEKTPGRKNLCGLPCTDLLDTNITDDIKCVIRAMEDSGLNSWQPWTKNCKGKNLTQFTDGC